MDMRTLIRWNPDPAKYCTEDCAAQWEPLLAPAGAKPNIEYPTGFGDRRGKVPEGYVQPQKAPDWTIIQSAAGLQWVYKGWLVVFTRKNARAGSTEFDGTDHMTWNTLKFVPPVPEVLAPETVAPTFVNGAYALTNKDGHVLFSDTCPKVCDWTPLAGGMASRGIGEWTISNSGEQPQWHYRGKPVFVSQQDDPTSAPANTTILRP
jgi:predicted lipoprotein with Yx(FWY)xxD motif